MVNIYLQGTESVGTLIAKLDPQDEGKVLHYTITIDNQQGTLPARKKHSNEIRKHCSVVKFRKYSYKLWARIAQSV